MGWKHIVVEGHCFFGKSEANDNIPKCCKNGPGILGFIASIREKGNKNVVNFLLMERHAQHLF
ncbi:hypothetical protein [Acetivibrio clariflavus]|uniref:Uncharacterized protein n=1 Tax=Acetivibrio clariflavus (strain DSM 19732 / NBRC 101661 / EBR45) TaxID=720554 RepID=G8LZJ0_ACECE|nr:hypothetical protein [Acetivibrio clariflavus]AEV66853.1 hypothetical protein Clocl_0101 [Acetivibrio clariflavus DSM 19732]HOP99551.1 hypothetical protein [Acetivibrio clariflavus]HPU41221.1 hypothetical protein [Acetivibrio clariflavus]